MGSRLGSHLWIYVLLGMLGTLFLFLWMTKDTCNLTTLLKETVTHGPDDSRPTFKMKERIRALVKENHKEGGKHQEDFDNSCKIMHWHLKRGEIAFEAIPPLICSTGGYDLCPPYVDCVGNDHGFTKDFRVTLWDTLTAPVVESLRMQPQFDVLIHSLFQNSVSPEYDIPWKYPWQSWTVVAMESEMFDPRLRTSDFYRQWDFSFGFRDDLFSHRLMYIRSNKTRTMKSTGSFAEKRIDAVAASMTSGGIADRNSLIFDLSQWVPTHHFTGPLQNQPNIPGHFDPIGPRLKIAKFSEYKFCYAIENFRETNFVTEKFFDALEAGCIPIYWGAPNIKEVWRYPDSFIDLQEFATLKDASEWIMKVANDAKLFNSYFDWKTRLPLWLEQLFFDGLTNTPCRMCVAHWQNKIEFHPGRNISSKAFKKLQTPTYTNIPPRPRKE